MKPFLGIDKTVNKNNEMMNGNEFRVFETPEYLIEAHDKYTDEHQDVVKFKSRKIINGFMVFFLIVALIILRGIIGAVSDGTPLKQCYANAQWMFLVGGFSAITALGLFIYSKVVGKKIDESDETKTSESRIESTEKNIYRMLGVPQDAPYIDVLSFEYKIKNGEIKPKDKALKNTPFVNVTVKCFADSENLCFAALDCKYAFPFSSIKDLKKVDETGNVPVWTKDEEFNKGFYKQFKIKYNDGYHFKPYYILEIEHNGEQMGIYLPPYDIHNIEKILNITAEK